MITSLFLPEIFCRQLVLSSKMTTMIWIINNSESHTRTIDTLKIKKWWWGVPFSPENRLKPPQDQYIFIFFKNHYLICLAVSEILSFRRTDIVHVALKKAEKIQ